MVHYKNNRYAGRKQVLIGFDMVLKNGLSVLWMLVHEVKCVTVFVLLCLREDWLQGSWEEVLGKL